MDRTLTLRFYLLADSSVDPSPCGSADESFITSLSSLPTCQQYHLVHISTEDLTDIHSGDSPTNPPPIVINRKRSSPTGSACSNTSREGDNSPTGSAGKCYITLAAEEVGGCLGNHPIPLKRSCNISAHFTRCNAR